VEQVSTIGLDIAKHVFQVHGADGAGHVLFRKRITRAKLLNFLAAQTRCVVAMEACAGAHYWAREIAKLGHRVRLIAPAYVKPFIKRQKNDAADAEAICEAAQRPSMRFGRGMKLGFGIKITPLYDSDHAMHRYLAAGDVLDILMPDEDSMPCVEREWRLPDFDEELIDLCSRAWL